jgi:8-oxo-dGTP pyrophosphatase MutT (NUDIX family)
VEAIAILIVHDDSKALVVKREQRDDEVSPWVFPAGVAEDDVERGSLEIAEYLLGVDAEDVNVLEKTSHETSSTGVTYVAVSATPPISPQDEIKEYDWMTPDELRKLNVDIDPVVLEYLSKQ